MNQENRETQNPFLQEWTTPHGTIPFDKIHVDDFEPALKIALDKANDEIERITSNPDAPTFENTIEALAKPNELLDNVCNTLFNLMSAETNDQIDEVAQNVSLKLTEHSTEVMFNKKLFARVKAVYEQKPALNAEESMLLNKTYNSFVRSGANLSDEDQQKMKALEAEKSQLTIKFSQNNLKENAKFILHITDEDDLAGLPESSVEAAKQAAE
ncbi:MAG: peptidase M3, partial [Bacteroidaceae bacterium]|nr:peptidase M3 [Bacteroidaceae bacterium]